MRTASPPIVPPAIAPIFDFFGGLLGADDVVTGRTRVGDRRAEDEVALKYAPISGLSHLVGAVTVAPPVGLCA
jgi:hypothetical protein